MIGIYSDRLGVGEWEDGGIMIRIETGIGIGMGIGIRQGWDRDMTRKE